MADPMLKPIKSLCVLLSFTTLAANGAGSNSESGPVTNPMNDWTLVWADEFDTNGSPDPDNWNYERGFVRNRELQWYQPENAFCTNGLLIIEARPAHKRNPNFDAGSTDWRTSREWIDYTSASLTSRRLREFTYGKFEMRARMR
jgi:beta-glucanase (GH16 family)